MSGICGIIHFDGKPVDPDLLHGMANIMAYRGPDGIDYWIEGSVGLAHLMLFTTPESLRERQPLVSKRGELVLVADARVDNRDELIRFLTAKSILEDQDPTDADLILAAYEAWGEACPEHLHGDFAFAIWDARQQRLFCARDRFGVRSFYYHLSDNAFTFGTEVKTLLSLPWVPRRVNDARIMMLLSNRDPWDKTSTFYEDIVNLASAHSLVLHDGQIVQNEYWALDPQRELRLPSDEAYTEAFLELFTEAVRCRLRSAYPFGAALSGGLDSSSIACTARKLLDGRERLYTFSCIFDEVPESDEREYMATILTEGGFDPTFVHGDQISPFSEVEQVLYHLDEPLAIPNLFLSWGMYRAAQAQGLRVFLDGYGGDQVISYGWLRITELARSGHLITLASEALRAAHNFNRPWWWYLYYRVVLPHYSSVHQLVRPLVPTSLVKLVRWLRSRRLPRATLSQEKILNPQFARQHLPPENYLDPPHTVREEHNQLLIAEFDSWELKALDKACAAFTLEGRYPFFDTRLAVFCLSLPSDQKLRQGYPRSILRRAMAGILPEQIRLRTSKGDLSHNFDRRLLMFDLPLLKQALFEIPGLLAPYIQPEALQALFMECLQSPQNSSEQTYYVWKVTNLALWLRLQYESR